MYMYVVCLSVCLHTMYMQVPSETRSGHQLPRNELQAL